MYQNTENYIWNVVYDGYRLNTQNRPERMEIHCNVQIFTIPKTRTRTWKIGYMVVDGMTINP